MAAPARAVTLVMGFTAAVGLACGCATSARRVERRAAFDEFHRAGVVSPTASGSWRVDLATPQGRRVSLRASSQPFTDVTLQYDGESVPVAAWLGRDFVYVREVRHDPVSGRVFILAQEDSLGGYAEAWVGRFDLELRRPLPALRFRVRVSDEIGSGPKGDPVPGGVR